MKAENIVTVEGRDLDYLVRNLVAAAQQGRRVRFTVEDGLKWDAGAGWTPGYGTMAGPTGYSPFPASVPASPTARIAPEPQARCCGARGGGHYRNCPVYPH